MKSKLSIIIMSIILLLSIIGSAQEIIPKKKDTTKRVIPRINKTIKKKSINLEKSIGGILGKKKEQNKEEKTNQSKNNEQAQSNNNNNQQTQEKPMLKWSKYDFIPGDKVIFEDKLINEENGEFPSRWDLDRGNVEIAEFGGENVIMFRDGAPTIIPYIKDAKEDYLPDIFTIEFDLYTGPDNFVVYFYDRKNQQPCGTSLKTNYNRMKYGQSYSFHPENKNLEKRRWIHIAIAFTNGKLKGYLDETRLINIPRVDFNPKGLSLHSYHCKNNNLYYIKNIRIAEGGVKYYDKVMQDGKIIANGIRFKVNSSSLLPESMGIINSIYTLMEKNSEIKFSIEGHTDSDGDEATNQLLSEQRAQRVLLTLTDMGITSDRLESKGWGENKPIDTNSTPEGKANNRRVEFVRINR